MADQQHKLSAIADFAPTKRFFVEMLTRDIDLADAILDLLDNCLDGVARSHTGNDDVINYKGFWAKIQFDGKHFCIEDNCGGIPASNADYAFRMGKPINAPKENLATVGVYGIGMKRSIFKMGGHCIIETQHADNDQFKITIDQDWLSSDQNWKIPMQSGMALGSRNGTKITVSKLTSETSRYFRNKSFVTDLINKVVFSYSYIINKQFRVEINGQVIKPNPINLRYETHSDENKKSIQPYIYEAEIDDVEIKLIVGFHAPLIDESVEEAEKKRPQNSTQDAGWTIVCNDRVVVYRDKTELTGWGVHFARYHTQFIGISGTLYFTSKQPEKLPITTTKRGIDASSPLFQKAQKHIIDGTKLFINYTNQWKGSTLLKQSNSRLLKSEEALPLDVIEKFREHQENWANFRNRSNERYFKPELPTPPDRLSSGKKITFKKPIAEIETVIEHLSLPEESTPGQTGEACFDYVHREAVR